MKNLRDLQTEFKLIKEIQEEVKSGISAQELISKLEARLDLIRLLRRNQ